MFSSETRRFILQHRLDDVKRLALNSRFGVEAGLDIPTALVQIAGRQAVKYKIPSWYENDSIIYSKQLSLEQCSSEATARYKASLLSGNSFVDLTGGFGVDCAFISTGFKSTVYVEQQPELCIIARHNFSQLNLHHISVVNNNSSDYLQQIQSVDCIFLDPARRASSGRKTILISDCEPDVNQMKPLLLEKAGCVVVKLSPMLDISLALKTLTETFQVHVLSVDNECKELLFLLKKKWVGEPEIVCINLTKTTKQKPFSFLQTEEKEAIPDYTSEIKNFLYEPNVSVLKAGAFKLIALRYHLQKLHPDSHIYTSQEWIPDFPGRKFNVEAVFSLNKNDLKLHLHSLKQANLSIRNFPSSVDELRKKLKLKEGGGVYLFATTLHDGKKQLIKCRQIMM